jgi:UPF0271 protein
MAPSIDLNSDLGEGFGRWSLGDDESLLAVVTSANVACGFHAGDPSIMRRVCERAVANGVAIGAQVSYPDLAGFGRRFMDIDPNELADAVLYQIGALQAFARAAGGEVSYVKPHGALYNAIVHHEAQARAVVEGIVRFAPGTTVLGLPASAFLRVAAAAGLRPCPEAFADRGYRTDGSLVPRSEPGAVIRDPDAVVARAVAMVVSGSVSAADGSSMVEVSPASICVHGDTPGAAELATRVRLGLESAGVTIAAFAE